MSNGENSVDGSVSSPNEELNISEMESDNLSENGEGGGHSEKMDPADRELYEKLKRQEREEREEIERELKRAHEEAIVRRHEELRAKELRMHAERIQQLEQERGQDLRLNKHLPHSEEFRAHREGLSLSESPRLDILSHSAFLAERYHRNSHSPQSPTSISPTGDGPTHHWTFEEQFKQLYELSEDPKRKEFLDDLFQFMQKRGTPVNRIPIMAKQTLDLYELFRLVVSKGGLVEVINKKLWREITKGLNLPSSITSAAFTLRTQYMKYLYPYECEKLKLSSPQELQAAIDGNRREGRRSSYGYDLSPGPTLIPTAHHPHLNGNLLNGKFGGSTSAGFFSNADRRSPLTSLQKLWQLQAHQLCSEEESMPPTSTHHHRTLTEHHLTERDAIAMEAASRVMEHATRKMEEASRAAALVEEPPRKRLMTSEEERIISHNNMPSTHIKITSRNDGRTEIDNSLVVSMEINGIMYQGVLFAHQPRRL
ncbi:AT-rich interactive domain-containing protein 3A-like isoform X1 [Mizuhopecten yessoensis]|uniref:AT-rich interactive domain-containing protein 3A-like isoform X1 n=1 Tax=Mizuhopecten yessoensis TaxID=6573 RepID=UPI000B459BA0|nr:AT-rich interactive domain-containing protein 3A-like isoform X1 [Mizuhopecten yessoensis]